MLPASLAVPKELFPVGRQPAMRWVVDEAVDAGVERVVVVSSSTKPTIDAYVFGPLREELTGTSFEVVHQPAARGLGDAVRIARRVADEPFTVLLPDEILLGGSRLLRQMLADFEASGQSSVSLLPVDPAAIGAYGCAKLASGADKEGRASIVDCIEKPSPESAPSRLALSGRYVIGEDVLEPLEGTGPDGRGEVQLTAALAVAARTTHIAGFEVRDEDGRVDVGHWAGWLEANLRTFGFELLDQDMVVRKGG